MKRPVHASRAVACGLAGDVIRAFGETRLRVFGTSMVPSIFPGDLISVQRKVLAEISSGEIVSYAREGRIFAHRAVGHSGSPDRPLLITRGDLLACSDPPVSSSELLGKVISIERGGRQIKTASAPRGLSLAFIRLLRTSGRATYLYVKLASWWESLVSPAYSRRLENGLPSAGTKVATCDVARPATLHYEESSPENFDARLRPLETEGAAKCQA